MDDEIRAKEMEIYELVKELETLRESHRGCEIPDYEFQTLSGKVHLSDLFAGKNGLFVILNMGQGCRYCTMWADGINAFLPHLENEFSVVLVSKDDPETQRRFANERGWRFRLASHGGGIYAHEESVEEGNGNGAGIVYYEMDEDVIRRKNSSVFGPRDQFCSIWHILSLASRNEENWFPQFKYWTRPETLDDGGQNLVE